MVKLALVVPIVVLLMGIIVCILALVGAAARLGGRRPSAREAEEARIMQEIHQGLTRMEERIEALETILLEREEKPSTY